MLFNCRDGAKGGGVAIVLPKNLQTTRINVPKFTSIEALLVRIELHSNHRITLGVIYHTKSIGNCNLQTSDLDKIKSLLGNYPYIIGGDFNSHNIYWKSSRTDPNGATLLDWSISISSCDILTADRPTFPSSGSYLDLFLVHLDINLMVQHFGTNTLEAIDTFSDHRGVVLPLYPSILKSHFRPGNLKYDKPVEVFNYNYKLTG